MRPLTIPPADAPPPSPAVLSHGRDAVTIRGALARLPRPLVCACGAVEAAPGASPVGALVRPLRASAVSVEAVCAACAIDPRQLVSLGALPPPAPRRRAPVVAERPATVRAAVALTLAPVSRGAEG